MDNLNIDCIELYIKQLTKKSRKGGSNMCIKDRVLIIVGAATVLSFLFAGPLSAQPIGIMSPRAQNISQYAPLLCPGGRFVFGQVSDSSKDQYMLDTLTGRLWRLSESGEVGKYLAPVPYKLGDGKYAPMPERVRGNRASKGSSLK